MSEEPGLDREATERVLERAMELDIKVKDELTADQIRAIATDLGISPRAIQQALREHASAATEVSAIPAPVPVAPLISRFYRPGRLLAAAAMLYLIGSLVARMLFPGN